MRIPIDLGNDRMIVLLAADRIDPIDMDAVTTINYSNLFGEAVTCSALLNRIGQLKADAEAIYNAAKLELGVYESRLKKDFRKESLLGGGRVRLEDGTTVKLTENGLDDLVKMDKNFQTLSKEVIYRKRDLDYLDSLNWAISSKDRKLNTLLPKVTPEEFWDGIVEGAINTFVIKKV